VAQAISGLTGFKDEQDENRDLITLLSYPSFREILKSVKSVIKTKKESQLNSSPNHQGASTYHTITF
jgi:hypothetical protein